MIAAHNDAQLRDLGARLLLQVHDELIVEAPAANIEAAGARLRTIMQGAEALDVPLKVDMGTGRTWADAH